MKPKGGTELAVMALQRHVDNNLLSKVNFIASACRYELLSEEKPNFIWQQLSYDQENVALMNDYAFQDRIEKFAFVSDWQMNKFIDIFNCPEEKSVVIRNAITPFEIKEKPQTDKLKLIYISTPWRGLDVLMDVVDKLNRDDIELDVYSSTIIYGKGFMPNAYDELFHRCRTTKNVNYKGYAMNKAVRNALESAHILAYPNTFEETSCISAIEAGSAGCKIVTTNYGALPETCDQYASYVDYTSKEQLVDDYAELLNEEINNYWDNSFKDQVEFFNSKYSWETRKHEWEEVLKQI